MMKNKLTNMIRIGLCATALSTISCTDGPNARSGTAVGAMGGAAAGGIIGHQSGNTMQGALIGGGLGALGGNAIGGENDRKYNRR
jgi:5'-3' exoribonuclease 2